MILLIFEVTIANQNISNRISFTYVSSNSYYKELNNKMKKKKYYISHKTENENHIIMYLKKVYIWSSFILWISSYHILLKKYHVRFIGILQK